MPLSSPSPIRNVTVLGTGKMGFPIAQRLCQAGFNVAVWNRSKEKAAPLAVHGAMIHEHASDAVGSADLVISLLENGPVVAHVLFELGVAQAMPPNSLLMDMASIKPAEARDHAQRLEALGIQHLDAPVSGGTVGAENGQLAIMVGGEADCFERVLTVLSHLGRPTLVGPHGAGQLAKLANQMIVGITIGAVAEALLLCAKGGADMAKVREAIGGGFAQSRILDLHGQRMVERDFAPRAKMTVQLKDMRNALDTAAELGFSAPITALFETLYAEAIDHGLSDLDHSGLFVELANRNQLV